jgi:hypothetical protein
MLCVLRKQLLANNDSWAVSEDCLTACRSKPVDRTMVGKVVSASRIAGKQEETMLSGGPQLVQRVVCLKDMWCVWPVAAVPGAIDATVYQARPAAACRG